MKNFWFRPPPIMAKLSKTERAQLRQASRTKSSPGRPVRQSPAGRMGTFKDMLTRADLRKMRETD
ncbi:MAG: hypothetical protein PSW75_07310 [bacterium]|nr:hypothetical protein [bacterium]